MEGMPDQSILRSHSDPHMQHACPSLPQSTSASSSHHNFSSAMHHFSDSQNSINMQNQAPHFLCNLNPAGSSHSLKKGPAGGPLGRHSSGERRAAPPNLFMSEAELRAHGLRRSRPDSRPGDIQPAPVASSSASWSQNGAEHMLCSVCMRASPFLCMTHRHRMI
jgi:hypothetical protein